MSQPVSFLLLVPAGVLRCRAPSRWTGDRPFTLWWRRPLPVRTHILRRGSGGGRDGTAGGHTAPHPGTPRSHSMEGSQSASPASVSSGPRDRSMTFKNAVTPFQTLSLPESEQRSAVGGHLWREVSLPQAPDQPRPPSSLATTWSPVLPVPGPSCGPPPNCFLPGLPHVHLPGPALTQRHGPHA